MSASNRSQLPFFTMLVVSTLLVLAVLTNNRASHATNWRERHVEIDRAAFEVVSRHAYRAITNDPTLTDQQKREAIEALNVWGRSIERAELHAAEPAPQEPEPACSPYTLGSDCVDDVLFTELLIVEPTTMLCAPHGLGL